MKKVKNILFKMDMVGNGIVNFAGNEQMYLNNLYCKETGNKYIKDNNVSLAKSNYYLIDGKIDKKIIISANCLRYHLFLDTITNQTPNTISSKYLLTSMLASPALLIRGYTQTEINTNGFKRKSALNITSAEQTSGSIPTIHPFIQGGGKKSADDRTSNSFFFKETVGDISYSTKGNIDLMALQFISTDEVFDRLAFNPDLFEIYSKLLKSRMQSFNSTLKHYKIINSVTEHPELGALLSNEDILFLVKHTLKRMLNLSMRTSDSYAETSKLYIKFVYDVIDNKLNNNEGWIEITNDYIDNLTFDSEIFYEEVDEELVKMIDDEITETVKRNKEERAKREKEEKERKESKKGKKETVNED